VSADPSGQDGQWVRWVASHLSLPLLDGDLDDVVRVMTNVRVRLDDIGGHFGEQLDEVDPVTTFQVDWR